MLPLSLATKTRLSACVSGLAKYYGRSPDKLDAAAIQAYLLHLICERKLAYASVNQAVCAIRFLFAVVLGQREVAFDIPMAKVPKRLPQILTRNEVTRLLSSARDIRARTLLTTTYAAGLRLSEVCNLQLTDIESSPERMCLHLGDHVEQLAANHLGLDKNCLATLVNTMQSEYILGKINAYGDNIHGLPLSKE